jgi:hypothetical protein
VGALSAAALYIDEATLRYEITGEVSEASDRKRSVKSRTE